MKNQKKPIVININRHGEQFRPEAYRVTQTTAPALYELLKKEIAK